MGEAAARLLLDTIDTGRTPPTTVRRLACPCGQPGFRGSGARPVNWAPGPCMVGRAFVGAAPRR
ncbi:hypothetical protein ACRAWF_41390 [Streptomyces sp. L7]